MSNSEENETVKTSESDSQPLFSDETIQSLTNGFLEILQPEVTRVQKSLDELMYVSLYRDDISNS